MSPWLPKRVRAAIGRRLDGRVNAALDARAGSDRAAINEEIERAIAAALERHRSESPHLSTEDLLHTPLIFGEASRLTIAPTADVNDALFNLSSGTITVEDYAFFGHRVSCLTGTHDVEKFDRARQASVQPEGRDIVIGRGAWIASGATIIGPCRIGHDAVVYAGSVVTRDVGDYEIVAGVPARKVGSVTPPN